LNAVENLKYARQHKQLHGERSNGDIRCEARRDRISLVSG
jgi:hypothetical protein